jgi:osmoprotectant transport system permease protein
MKWLLALLALLNAAPVTAQEIQIGSKRFTESYVLGEIASGALRRDGVTVQHRQGMGGTIILWEALKSGAIDIYRSIPARSPKRS